MDSRKITDAHRSNVYDNFLIHWKYIKREKIVGAKEGEKKWKYWYKDDKDRTNTAKESVQNVFDKLTEATQKKKTDVSKDKQKAQVPSSSNVVDKVKDKLGFDEKATYEKQKSNLDKARENVAKAKERLEKAQTKYAQTASEAEQKKEALDVAEKKEKNAKQAYDRQVATVSEEKRKQNLDNATKQRETAEKDYKTAQTKADNAEKYLDQTQTAYDDFTKRTNAAYDGYQLAKTAYEDTVVYKVSELAENAKGLIDDGKNAVNNLFNKTDVGDKTTEELGSFGVRAALVAGTLLSKIVSKVNHETGEKIEEKVTEKRAEKSREEAAEKGFINEELVKNDPLPMLPVKTEATTADEDMNAINPKYERGTYAYTMNCSYCTAAYDLRRRGYDVQADAISTHDPSTIYQNIASWYDGEEIKSFDVKNSGVSAEEASAQLEAELKSYGDGARGHLMLYWTNGGGHDVIWEVEHGDVVIRDCQTNQKLEVVDYLQLTKDGMYFRTDNIQPNEKILETVKSRK